MNFYSVNTCEKVKSGNILMYNNFLFCQLCILSNFILSTLFFVNSVFVNFYFVNFYFVNSVLSTLFCQLLFCQTMMIYNPCSCETSGCCKLERPARMSLWKAAAFIVLIAGAFVQFVVLGLLGLPKPSL